MTCSFRYCPRPVSAISVAARPPQQALHARRSQVLALRWVREHIGAFGGDAQRVSVFGESAGGCSTCMLALTPLARGLVQRSIVESGPCVGTWGPEPKAYGWALREALMLKLGAPNETALERVDPAKLQVCAPSVPQHLHRSPLPHQHRYLA